MNLLLIKYTKKNEIEAPTITAADKLFEGKFRFEKAAALASEFFNADGKMPEVAFVGRSNVGKSSLINALTMQG